MKRRIVLITIFLLVIFASGLFYLKWVTLPVYRSTENGLSFNNMVFLSGPSEFGLEPLELGDRIGKTTEGFQVFEVKGQRTRDWVFVRGLMFEGLYRNEKVVPVKPANLRITEIQIISTPGSQNSVKSTKNPKVINEIIEILYKQNPKKTIVKGPMKSDELRLLSPDLPGFGIFTYCIIDDKKEIYISKLGEQDSPVKAGKLFSEWVIKSSQKR